LNVEHVQLEARMRAAQTDRVSDRAIGASRAVHRDRPPWGPEGFRFTAIWRRSSGWMRLAGQPGAHPRRGIDPGQML